jgi:hypothetical protein
VAIVAGKSVDDMKRPSSNANDASMGSEALAEILKTKKPSMPFLAMAKEGNANATSIASSW